MKKINFKQKLNIKSIFSTVFKSKSEKQASVFVSILTWFASLFVWYAILNVIGRFILAYIINTLVAVHLGTSIADIVIATVAASVFSSFLIFLWWTPNKIYKWILWCFKKEPYPFFKKVK